MKKPRESWKNDLLSERFYTNYRMILNSSYSFIKIITWVKLFELILLQFRIDLFFHSLNILKGKYIVLLLWSHTVLKIDTRRNILDKSG